MNKAPTMYTSLILIEGIHVMGIMDTVNGKLVCHCAAIGYVSPAIKAEYEAENERIKKLNQPVAN